MRMKLESLTSCFTFMAVLSTSLSKHFKESPILTLNENRGTFDLPTAKMHFQIYFYQFLLQYNKVSCIDCRLCESIRRLDQMTQKLASERTIQESRGGIRRGPAGTTRPTWRWLTVGPLSPGTTFPARSRRLLDDGTLAQPQPRTFYCTSAAGRHLCVSYPFRRVLSTLNISS